MLTSYTFAPKPEEYAPFYGTYVNKVPVGDIIAQLRAQLESTVSILGEVDEVTARKTYAPGKWTLKEVLGHMIDAERIFAVRAFCFSRGEAQPLPGFDQDKYVDSADFNSRTLSHLLSEFSHIRQATLQLIEGMNAEMMECSGTASNTKVSVRALAYIIAGHELHHVQILQQKYLGLS